MTVNLLAQQVEHITYQDVVNFCGEQVGEGTTLDYKQQIPRDLAKHIAAMSNRYGGLIIIGVEEDPKTGLPRLYDGTANDGKLVERANQFAANVRPLPSCVIRTTDEVKGNVFLLVRVYEGGAPPFTTTSDPTVYLRTGNVTTQLGRADADVVRELYAKRTEAETVQAENVAQAQARLDAVINWRSAEESRRIREGTVPLTVTSPGDLRLLTAYLQPFYPSRDLAPPWAIQAKLDDLRLRDHQERFFPGRQMRPIAGGMMTQANTRFQVFSCQQVYANGLVYSAENTVWPDSSDDLHLDQIARLLYLTLRFGGRLYASLEYSGLVRGAIGLTNAQGRPVQQIVMPERHYFASDRPATIDSTYDWSIEADTHQLTDDDWLHRYFKEQMRHIYWDLGYNDVPDEALDYVITSIGID